MAGDWIKMRVNLRSHPKVVRMSSALKADRLRVIGGLHSAWCLFDEHSIDGRLEGYRPETLDEDIGFPGFSAAMIAVEWLSDDGDSLATPRFDEHNGQSAKRRAQDSERKRNDRKLSAEVSALEADKKRTREEKRREEKKNTTERGTRLPEDWHPSVEETAFCKTERPDLVPSEVAKSFYDYWIAVPGSKGVKLNWSSTWRNWVRAQRQGKAPVEKQEQSKWV